MPLIKPHSHPCSVCHAKTECGGTWQENYDGIPAVICPEYHLDGGETNTEFVCESCHDAAERQLAIEAT